MQQTGHLYSLPRSWLFTSRQHAYSWPQHVCPMDPHTHPDDTHVRPVLCTPSHVVIVTDLELQLLSCWLKRDAKNKAQNVTPPGQDDATMKSVKVSSTISALSMSQHYSSATHEWHRTKQTQTNSYIQCTQFRVC